MIGSSSPETFQRFLLWLDPDARRAGEKYNHLHASLAQIFECRGCDRPRELADEVLDRVIRKVDVVAPGYEGDPAAYVHGVAKNVWLEHTRFRARRRETELPNLDIARADTGLKAADPEVEAMHSRLDRCLGELAVDDREMLLRYYQRDKWAKVEDRRQLADDAALSSVALRKRVQRIRMQVRDCLLRTGITPKGTART